MAAMLFITFHLSTGLSRMTNNGALCLCTRLGDGSWVDYEVELSARSELSGGTIFVGENLKLQHPNDKQGTSYYTRNDA